MRALFLVNRRSGAKRRHQLPEILHRHCSLEHEIQWCERIEDLDGIIASAIGAGFDLIYAVGGDGTVHEIAKRLIGRPAALGIIPIGSGNGFARHIGLPIAVEHSLRACSRGRIEIIDTATVNGIPFLATMGIGFDAWIAAEFATRGTRGLRTYIRVGLAGFFSYQPEHFELRVDDQRIEQRALLLTVANASQYGNNARIAPAASLQDGRLDVTLVKRRSIAAVFRLFTGSLDHAPGVTMTRGQHIEIRRPAAGPAHLDGEPVTLPESLVVDVVPKSLRILLPDRARMI